MEQGSTGETMRARLEARRDLVREQGRPQQALGQPLPSPVPLPGSVRYRTPEWLERSYVLPIRDPVTEVFVRSPSEDVDFARVVRRSDLQRVATRLHWSATGLAGIGLVAYLLLATTPLLLIVITLAVVACGGLVARVALSRAPVPRVQRPT